jgi:predicted Zn-dependent protease with MMP-like domain
VSEHEQRPGPAQAGGRGPPTADDIVRVCEAVLADFPGEIRALLREMPIRVQDWADEATLDDMGYEDPLELTGLFRGTPIGERAGAVLPPAEPEMIFLYRMPILFEWCERGVTLEEVVFDVLTHEIGHFFGMEEAEVLRLEGRWPEDD